MTDKIAYELTKLRESLEQLEQTACHPEKEKGCSVDRKEELYR
jgi:hypothetical protein